MTEYQIGLLGIVFLFLFMILRMHVGVALSLVALAGIALMTNLDAAYDRLAQTAFSQSFSYLLIVMPLYLLMGELAYISGISKDVYSTVNKWMGHLPGGLAMATIGGCAGFSAVCGSSSAGSVVMLSIAYPEMRHRSYANSLSIGCIAAGGTMGILIPPSAALILYGLITEQSIGKLFLAGIFPGILLTVLFCLLIYAMAKRRPALAPPGRPVPWRERLISLKDLWSVTLLCLIVLGGIYSGVFTATEAAGIGTVAAFFIALIRRQVSRASMKAAIFNSVRVTGMIFLMIIGATMFNYFLLLSGLTNALADFCLSLPLPPTGIVIAIIFLYAVLGCLMDAWAMMLIIVPTVYPVIQGLGIDPIWFGIVTVIMVELGLITPPVGLNIFIMSGMVRDVPMTEIYSGVTPFVIALLLCVVLLLIFPQIALFLATLG